ncbi:hypothetical protein [Clostridium sp.]|uniref:hypothetical protein n=1 Tax=Clostridium sp. TaxID=1506 RepID=UPI001A497E19|nr:hypothetical protein [Clostridium sp.]MBK5242715.1 hypothetical protein [Clostridium sp.]
MKEEKPNSGNGNKADKKSAQDDVNKYSEKRILDIIYEQLKNLPIGSSVNQTISGTTGVTDSTDDCSIKALADKVLNMNILRFELDRLQLDFRARAYFENDVKPLIDTLTALSYASYNFSSTASNIASTNFGRTSNIKDALDLAEDVDEISEDLVKVLKCKVDNLLKLSKCDCK